uniref:Ubiquitin-like domain-containing protein n=1 Tax=Trichogramma kaykai TaxID=54128 RepID=A0ABD2XN71_9HYME
MPLFKIQGPQSATKVMVKGDSIEKIISAAKLKLKLPEVAEYKLMDLDGTIMDDDEILIDYAQHSRDVIILKIIETEKEEMEALNSGISATKNIAPNLKVLQVPHTESIDEFLWKKVDDRIIGLCKSKKPVVGSDRKDIYNRVADHMITKLKNTSRGKAEEFARQIGGRYSESFCDAVDDSTPEDVWDDGVDTLRQQILNAVNYKLMKMKASQKQKSVALLDSDDEEINARKKKDSLLLMQDEYGCVEYAPKLPESESHVTQEDKRLLLLQLFQNSEEKNEKIEELMISTYPTQRLMINQKNRDLDLIFLDWPYLKTAGYLFVHCNILLGKDLQQLWNNTLPVKAKVIRLYFQCQISNKKFQKNNSEMKDWINESKEASKMIKSKMPKIFVIFPLVTLFFKEKSNLLFKLVDETTENADMLKMVETEYPILLIQGKSLYDENAKCVVVINKNITVTCSGQLQGILVLFSAIYVFGFRYTKGLEKTLEFMQRYLLDINPKTTNKKLNKKHASRNYSPAVFTLTKNLKEFSLDRP